MMSKPGTMAALIEEHGNVAPTVNLREEADRLLPMVQTAGFNSTIGSVRQALTALRQRKKIVGPRAHLRKTTEAKRIKQNPRVAALENYLDDAMNALTLLKGEIKRLREIEKKYLTIKAQVQ